MILKPRNVDGLNKEMDVETSKNKTSGKREEPARNWKARQHTPAKWRLRKRLEKKSTLSHDNEGEAGRGWDPHLVSTAHLTRSYWNASTLKNRKAHIESSYEELYKGANNWRRKCPENKPSGANKNNTFLKGHLILL